MSGELQTLLNHSNKLIIHQIKEWVEIITDWETANRYEILNEQGEKLAYLAERKGGFLYTIKRLIFRSHRSFEIDVFDLQANPIMHMTRAFFFYFSDLLVHAKGGEKLGSVHRKFGILYKRYELCDAQGRVFAKVASPLWRLWTFPIKGPSGNDIGVISKRWQGFLKEGFTDADKYLLDMGQQQFSMGQKAVLLATAISIDFDFFENNEGFGVLGN